MVTKWAMVLNDKKGDDENNGHKVNDNDESNGHKVNDIDDD